MGRARLTQIQWKTLENLDWEQHTLTSWPLAACAVLQRAPNPFEANFPHRLNKGNSNKSKSMFMSPKAGIFGVFSASSSESCCHKNQNSIKPHFKHPNYNNRWISPGSRFQDLKGAEQHRGAPRWDSANVWIFPAPWNGSQQQLDTQSLLSLTTSSYPS